MELGERSYLPLFVAVVKRVLGAPRNDAWVWAADVASSSLFMNDWPTTPSGSGNVAIGTGWLSGIYSDTRSGVFGAVEPIVV